MQLVVQLFGVLAWVSRPSPQPLGHRTSIAGEGRTVFCMLGPLFVSGGFIKDETPRVGGAHAIGLRAGFGSHFKPVFWVRHRKHPMTFSHL
jgi:hypothetical protein